MRVQRACSFETRRHFILISFNRTGIGPEAFAYITPGGNSSSLSSDQQSFYDKHGFYITSSYYILRPEVLESNFYAWRITGDTKYLDRAASAVDSFKNYLSATVAYDGIYDVDSTSSDKVDDMESFWFAEVLKYLWVLNSRFLIHGALTFPGQDI